LADTGPDFNGFSVLNSPFGFDLEPDIQYALYFRNRLKIQQSVASKELSEITCGCTDLISKLFAGPAFRKSVTPVNGYSGGALCSSCGDLFRDYTGHRKFLIDKT